VPVSERPPSTVFDRGHAASVATPSERKRSSVAIDLARCAPSGFALRATPGQVGAPAGCFLPNDLPPTLYVIAPISDLWQRFPPSARSVRSRDLSLLAPVGETHPEAQSRRDRGISASLRFRGAWFGPSAPEVGAAASPPLPLPLRASTAARDTPQAGARKRAPSHDVSRPSRRGPPRQRHADWGLRGRMQIGDDKFEIRNSKSTPSTSLLVSNGIGKVKEDGTQDEIL